jgi:hypothetical protein
MTITSISTKGLLYTNELAPIDTENQPIRGDDGLAEVEVDDGMVTLHLRHYADDQACLSFQLGRDGALALAEVLRAAASAGE